MKKVLLFIFFALGILWVFVVTSLLPRRSLPVGSQWQLPKDKSALLNTSGINDVQYSPDGTRIAVASAIGVWFYDLNADKAPVPLTTDMTSVFSISFSPDGKTLAIGGEDELVRLWNVDTRNYEKTFIARLGPLLLVLFSPDGKTLASCSIYEINLWDVATGTHKDISGGYKKRASGLFINADGGTLARANYNGLIRLVNVVTGDEKRSLRGHTENVKSVAFSTDGQTLASSSWDKTVRLWDVATGENKKILKGHRKSVNSMAFSTDGQLLATASRDHTLRVWDTNTGKRRKTLKGHTAEVVGVSFSPDGQTIISWSNDRTIRLWDVRTGKFKKALKVPKF